MHDFDEEALVAQLEAFPSRLRAVFAAAAATRQLGNFERHAIRQEHHQRNGPREISIELWRALSADAFDVAAWSSKLEELTAMLPEEGEDGWQHAALAEDAIASLMYAIRCLLTSDAQEAAWSARRAYEAADQVAVFSLESHADLLASKELLLSHLVVQRELTRQQDDLSLMETADIERIRELAFLNELLTSSEARSSLPE